MLGVFAEVLVEPLAQVLKALGSQHVLVVHAIDGLDEISIETPTRVAELKDGEINCYTIKPEDFGISRGLVADLAVDHADESLEVIKAVLANEPGPARDIVTLNAGAAIYAANLTDSLAEGIEKAKQVIASGNARAKLDALVALTNSF